MNIKYIQELLSRINEVKIIGKRADIDGVVCNIAGIVRYGHKLRFIILEYDEVYRQKVEEKELSELCQVRQEETNRSILKGRYRTYDSIYRANEILGETMPVSGDGNVTNDR